MASSKELLKDLCGKIPGIRLVFVMDKDGIPVYDQGEKLDTANASAEISALIKTAKRSMLSLEVEGINSIILLTGSGNFLLYKSNGLYVGLLTKNDVNTGQARYWLESFSEDITKDLV